MVIMNIVGAKAKLSELVARAEAGEEVYIARNGKTRVRVEPLQPVEQSVIALSK